METKGTGRASPPPHPEAAGQQEQGLVQGVDNASEAAMHTTHAVATNIETTQNAEGRVVGALQQDLSQELEIEDDNNSEWETASSSASSDAGDLDDFDQHDPVTRLSLMTNSHYFGSSGEDSQEYDNNYILQNYIDNLAIDEERKLIIRQDISRGGPALRRALETNYVSLIETRKHEIGYTQGVYQLDHAPEIKFISGYRTNDDFEPNEAGYYQSYKAAIKAYLNSKIPIAAVASRSFDNYVDALEMIDEKEFRQMEVTSLNELINFFESNGDTKHIELCRKQIELKNKAIAKLEEKHSKFLEKHGM